MTIDFFNPSGDEQTVTHVVPEAACGGRLDEYLARALPTFPSRKSAYKTIKAGCVTVDGILSQPNAPVVAGQIIVARAKRQPRFVPVNLPLHVVFEDAFLAVVEKPPGIPVMGLFEPSVESALPLTLAASEAAGVLPWPKPVHRLDVPTGGLLLVAKTRSALTKLGRQFQQRTVLKRYAAIVAGRLDGRGMVTTPVDGRPAETEWQAVAHARSLTPGWLTLVHLWPRSGRKHQLRVHLAELGCPVVGDSVHGKPGEVFRGKSLFLWSIELSFTHPHTGDLVHVEVPVPPKFKTYFEREQRRWQRHRGFNL